jgi:hypothetical protein
MIGASHAYIHTLDLEAKKPASSPPNETHDLAIVNFETGIDCFFVLWLY